MGKCTTSLLSIVFQLYALSPILADEEVRQVQEALRKRHLFYSNPTGEMSPELSAAIARYQEKKGFPRTGSIDVETCASLGIAPIPLPHVAQTPFVMEESGTVRGANGERLPQAVLWSPDEYPVRFGLTQVEPDNLGRTLDASDIELTHVAVSHSKAFPRRAQIHAVAPKETNPILLAFRSVDHAVKFLFGDTNQKKKRIAQRRL
jgi:peptidoglycan hydrolase-like protein with peptidoglycan-binding domain